MGGAKHGAAAPQFPVVSQWHLTSRYPGEGGETVRLRVERYWDGTGAVAAVTPKGEFKWFVDGLPFDRCGAEYGDA